MIHWVVCKLTWQLFLGHVDLSLVHVVQDDLDLLDLDVLEKDDGVLARVLHEEALEVGGAGREDHLVALDGGVLAGQRHVAERLRLQQLVQHRQQVVAVVVPAQAVLLRLGSRHRHPGLAPAPHKGFQGLEASCGIPGTRGRTLGPVFIWQDTILQSIVVGHKVDECTL